jgi:hypothetical protein
MLQGYQESDEDKTELQLIMLFIFVTIICLCQGAIETKKYLMSKAEQRVDILAVSALKQIEEATKRLHTENPQELNVNNLSATIKIAWETDEAQHQEEIQRVSGQKCYQVKLIDRQNSPMKKSSKEQAVKIARLVSLYGLFPALVTIFNLSISSNYGYRPHASTGSFLSIYGVFIPMSIIVNNPKIKRFAKKLIYRQIHKMSLRLNCQTLKRTVA